MAFKKLNFLVIGAHPDDCDSTCGATAIKLSNEGHRVKFVSMTDGSAGHQKYDRATLAEIRKKESANSAAIAGIEYQVLDYPDGQLEVTLETREKTVKLIREFDPDIIITHRINDYHPDHRYTSQLVQDASYLVMVPNVCPDVPILMHQPAIFYMCDEFKRPYKFSPDVIVKADDVFSKKLEMVSCHKSQYSDWLPWIGRLQGEIPNDFDDSKYAFWCVDKNGRDIADRFRNMLNERYGNEKGGSVKYAEAFELSEYGSQMDSQSMNTMFPL